MCGESEARLSYDSSMAACDAADSGCIGSKASCVAQLAQSELYYDREVMHSTCLNGTKPWLKQLFWGALEVIEYLGRNTDGKRTFRVECSCLERENRTEDELHVRKLQCCAKCRAERTEETRLRKEDERRKDHRHHAHYRTADQDAP
jgi:hypothetical protein